jgi:hypothetical protein
LSLLVWSSNNNFYREKVTQTANFLHTCALLESCCW